MTDRSDPLNQGIEKAVPPRKQPHWFWQGLSTGVVGGLLGAGVGIVGGVYHLGKLEERLDTIRADVTGKLEAVRAEVRGNRTLIENHKAWHDGRAGSPVHAAPMPSANPPGKRDMPWTPEFRKAREAYCTKRCGQKYPETTCHGECRQQFHDCGMGCRADPKDPCFKSCVKALNR